MASVPAELTWIGDRGSSLALSAYSAVMLRKMLPVHTNRIAGIVFTAEQSTKSVKLPLGAAYMPAVAQARGKSPAMSQSDSSALSHKAARSPPAITKDVQRSPR